MACPTRTNCTYYIEDYQRVRRCSDVGPILQKGRYDGRVFEVSRPGGAGPIEHGRIFYIRRCIPWRLSARRHGQRDWIHIAISTPFKAGLW